MGTIGELTDRQHRVHLYTEEQRVASRSECMLRAGGASERQAFLWAHYFDVYGHRVGVDPALLIAIAYTESRLNPWAINRADPSYGLMQVMPRYWRYSFRLQCGAEATPITLMDPRVAICHGAYIAGYFRAQYGDERGVTAYNNGSGRYNGYSTLVYRHLRTLGRDCPS
jgi:soluble lytic murein transglycosylase-like protein